MTTSALTIAYTPAEQTVAPRAALTLEQEPVPVAPRLTYADLMAMLHLVMAGTSARAHRPADCPVAAGGGQVLIDTAVYVWPDPLDLAYDLRATLGELGTVEQFCQEREFDVVLAFETEHELPFLVEDVAWSWSALPCWDRFGRDVGRPSVEISGRTIRTSGEWLGVIRLRATAVGYRHPLSLRFAKDDTFAITNIRAAATAEWTDPETGEQENTALDLGLPGCAEDLLALCPDGLMVRDHIYNVSSPDDLVPVVYYNACTGHVIGLRYEKP